MVECGSLENCFTLTRNGGSNPSSSAMHLSRNVQMYPLIIGIHGIIWDREPILFIETQPNQT